MRGPSAIVLARVLDDNPFAVALLTPDLGIRRCNTACRKMLEPARSAPGCLLRHDESGREFLSRADRLLYKAKADGRDRMLHD